MQNLSIHYSQDLTPLTFFVGPYLEATDNFKVALTSQRFFIDESGKSMPITPKERIYRFYLGLVLSLPVINVVVNFIRHFFIKATEAPEAPEAPSYVKVSTSNDHEPSNIVVKEKKGDLPVTPTPSEPVVETSRTLCLTNLTELDDTSIELIQKSELCIKHIIRFANDYHQLPKEAYQKKFKKLLGKIANLRHEFYKDTLRYQAASAGLNSLTQKMNMIVSTVKSHLLCFFTKAYNEKVETHIKESDALNPFLLEIDKKIIDIPEKIVCPKTLDDDSLDIIKTIFPENTIFPTLEYVQIPGLSQRQGTNYLCGYYALFFMLQHIRVEQNPDLKLEEELLDRKFFNQCFQEWRELIWFYKVNGKDYKNIQFEDPICVQVESLTSYLLFTLIQKSEMLKPVRESHRCFYVDLEEFHHLSSGIEKEILFEDPSLILKPVVSHQSIEFPCYLIVKKTDHFVLAYVQEITEEGKQPQWKIEIVHSLNYSIYSKEFGVNMLYNLPLVLFSAQKNMKFSEVKFVDVNIEPKAI